MLLCFALLFSFTRAASTSTAVEPKAKANALLAALPGTSLVSKTGWVTLTSALSAAAISSELFVVNEEVVILGSFVIFAGYIASVVRAPYTEWADEQIKVSPRFFHNRRRTIQLDLGLSCVPFLELR